MAKELAETNKYKYLYHKGRKEEILATKGRKLIRSEWDATLADFINPSWPPICYIFNQHNFCLYGPIFKILPPMAKSHQT